jgi:hypothetical protein
MQGKAVYLRPKVVGPFSEPCASGSYGVLGCLLLNACLGNVSVCALFLLVCVELLCQHVELNSESNFFEDASLKSTIEEKEEIEV